MTSFRVSHAVLLAGGTVALCLLLRRLAYSRPAPSSQSATVHPGPEGPARSTRQGVHLCQVNPDKNKADTDIDIIAVHGLDTKSPDTWTYRARNADDNVNWLADPRMLPNEVGAARIFTCDWPADLLQPSEMVPKTIEEYALFLLDGIQRGLSLSSSTSRDRPVFFIASCLGGIILAKALVDAGKEYRSLKRAARGIVFLATPFRGTSFGEVASWAEPGLRALASVQSQQASRLLNSVKGSTFDLESLVRRFTELCQDEDPPCLVFNFYEKGKTSLPQKIFPWLPVWLSQEKQLVDESSATLDFVPHPLPLDRPHVLMNKFNNPKCADYKRVAGKIQEFLRKIREGTPLAQADAWIRDRHYADRLKIERLSGDLLPMDQCYINLALVEQSGLNASRSKGEDEEDTAPSAFSLLARQKVETPDKTMQVELAAIFDKCKKRDGREIQPRRILIQGRAGVGKTTLCKKIVYDFTCGTQTELRHSWAKWFDRLLWVPLRNLKGRSAPGYNYELLSYHEFFYSRGQDDGYRLAKELSRELRNTYSSRTLFLLDGLDEITQELGLGDDMSRFIQDLLNQPNVIITSRPNASLPLGLQNPDLELETIGFYPDQVTAYLKADPEIKPRIGEVQPFLEKHWLIQGLVRIPIQLDALCYTWQDFDPGAVPDTMTCIYETIEQKLWKKDAVRLERVGKAYVETAQLDEIEDEVQCEIKLLECLAFNGLYYDIIDFTPTHQNEMAKRFPLQKGPPKLTLNETLARLSFMRTSDPSSKVKNRNYHFLHLTYQEYFAARYFVRQWTDCKQLEFIFKGGQSTSFDPPTDPAKFLGRFKYSARYDILWRFVAGLLESKGDGKILKFFDIIEEEPLDLLGPTHQRLVMRCLSEISSTKLPIRSDLEAKLSQWVLFECQHTAHSQMVCEMELPPQVIDKTLQEASKKERVILLKSLRNRRTIPLSTANLAASWLRDNVSEDITFAVLGMFSRQSTLPDEVLKAIMARVDDEDSSVRQAAIEALASQSQPGLSDEVLKAITARLDDEDWSERRAAIEALTSQLGLSDKVLKAVIARLDDKSSPVRGAAIEALASQPGLSDEVLKAITARLDDGDSSVRRAAIEALASQPGLSDEVLKAITARLDDEDWSVRGAAIEALASQPGLSDKVLKAITARLDDESSFVRGAAIEALSIQPGLSDEFLKAITARLDDESRSMRWAAIEALTSQLGLSDNVLKAITARLDDENWSERRAAIEALASQPGLSDEVLKAITARLDDEDSSVRRAAIEALISQLGLSDEVLKAIMARLDDEDSFVRLVAIKALASQLGLSDEVLKAITARLDDGDSSVRRAAIEALISQPGLSDEVLKAITARLDDGDLLVRRAAIDVLGSQPSLSYDLLKPYMGSLYNVLLEMGFCEHLCWPTMQGEYSESYLAMGLREVSLEGWPNHARSTIREKQKDLGAPLTLP